MGRRLLIAALLSVCVPGTLFAQDESYEAYFTVAKGESGLVLILSGTAKGQSLFVRDALDKKLDVVEWDFDLPLMRQFRVSKPGMYQIHLPRIDGQPIEYVSVTVLEGSLTYLQVAPINSKFRPGVSVEGWIGSPTDFAADLFEKLKATDAADEVLVPVSISPSDNVLYLSTEPPWKPPPKP